MFRSILLMLAWLATSFAAAAAGELSRWVADPSLPAGDYRSVAGGPGATTVAAWGEGLAPMRSFDGGRSWTAFVPPGMGSFDVSIAPSDGLTWYATVGGDLHRTRDGGTTWELRSRGVASGFAPLVGPDPDRLYLVTRELTSWDPPLQPSGYVPMLTSTDAGATWVRPASAPRVIRAAASAVDSRLAFVLGSGPSAGGNLWRTQDHGVTWTVMALPDPWPPGFGPTMLAFGEIALDRHDADIAYVRPEQQRSALAEHIYVTRDGGSSWSTVVQPQGTLVADPLAAGRVYLFAFDGRTIESRDAGRTWVAVDDRRGDGVAAASVVTRDGRRHARRAGRQLALEDGAVAVGSDLWWNPAESGRGLTITRHPSGNTFVVWYGYDAAGAPAWRVIPGGTWSDRTFTGEMFETTGPAYFEEEFDSSRVVARSVGSGTLAFGDENHAAFTWELADGTQGGTSITRQLFASPAARALPSYADLWWSAAQPGWGIGISHQGERIFATWYVYGSDGRPLWIVMPDAPVLPEFFGPVPKPAANGAIYTVRGPSSSGPFDPSAVVPTQVGTAKLLFIDAQHATLTYTAFGRTETHALTRQPF